MLDQVVAHGELSPRQAGNEGVFLFGGIGVRERVRRVDIIEDVFIRRKSGKNPFQKVFDAFEHVSSPATAAGSSRSYAPNSARSVIPKVIFSYIFGLSPRYIRRRSILQTGIFSRPFTVPTSMYFSSSIYYSCKYHLTY